MQNCTEWIGALKVFIECKGNTTPHFMPCVLRFCDCPPWNLNVVVVRHWFLKQTLRARSDACDRTPPWAFFARQQLWQTNSDSDKCAERLWLIIRTADESDRSDIDHHCVHERHHGTKEPLPSYKNSQVNRNTLNSHFLDDARQVFQKIEVGWHASTSIKKGAENFQFIFANVLILCFIFHYIE